MYSLLCEILYIRSLNSGSPACGQRKSNKQKRKKSRRGYNQRSNSSGSKQQPSKAEVPRGVGDYLPQCTLQGSKSGAID